MNPNIPDHLQALLSEIPENYEDINQIYLRGAALTARKGDKTERGDDRLWRYWLKSTGEEIKTIFYPNRPVTRLVLGVLTGILEEGSRPVILGRAPDHAATYFKVWHGVADGFGPYGDDKDLIVKAIEEPDWVKLRQDVKPRLSAGGNSRIKQTDSDTEDEPAGRAAASADAQVETPTNLASGSRLGSVRNTHPASATEPAIKIEDDGDINMLGTVPVGLPHTAVPSPLHNLQVRLKPLEPNAAVMLCRWVVCNTLKKLFSQALIAGIVSRDETMSGLLVEVIHGGEGPIEAFKVAEGDIDMFDTLHFALNQILGDRGLDGTIVEVSRI